MIYNLTRTQFFIATVPCHLPYRVVDNYLRALKTRTPSVRNFWFGLAIRIIRDAHVLACSFYTSEKVQYAIYIVK
jgi:hypothetical protein